MQRSRRRGGLHDRKGEQTQGNNIQVYLKKLQDIYLVGWIYSRIKETPYNIFR